MPAKKANDFIIRQVNESEAETLTKIHEQCFPNYWNREAFTDFFSVERTFAFLVEKGDSPIGMMVFRCPAEQVDLLTLAVIPEFRGQGIATFLMEQLIENCVKIKAEKILLEVEVDNLSALKLYVKLGFKEIHRRKCYYQQKDGSLTDAFVMEKKL